MPVRKNDADVFIDLAATTLLPNGNQAEKWEGLAIGPRLLGGGRVILAGNDNDYSVTQTGAGEQFDVYVNFAGSFARCVLDDPTRCEVDPPASDLTIDTRSRSPRATSSCPGCCTPIARRRRTSPATSRRAGSSGSCCPSGARAGLIDGGNGA